MRRIRLEIEYDGTAYCGWQRQLNGPTIQESLENALKKVTGETQVIHGSGRTDAGVHALAQVAHFDTESALPADRFAFAMNYYLPADIRIIASSEASPTFHARFDAAGKTYRYTYRNHPQRSALFRNLSSHHAGRLDVERMRQGAQFLLGEHDFRSFCAHAEGKDTVRHIDSIDIFSDGPYVVFEVSGSGFLHHMVRIIVGTLALVGTGQMEPSSVKTILDAKDRNAAGPTAPAEGLMLKEVRYS